jgi:hypothetical protein
MSLDDIDVSTVQCFSANILQMFQQQGSKLRGTVRERSTTGVKDFWSRIGPVTAVKKLVRHGPTPRIQTPHSARMATLVDWAWADLIDKQDLYKVLLDPTSEYSIAGGNALGRSFDSEIIRAFDADAYGGQDGKVLTTFVSECAADLDLSGAIVTVGDIVEAKGALDTSDVPDGSEDGRRHILLPPSGLAQLLRQPTAPMLTSVDYNKLKVLSEGEGEIEEFLGFKWHKSTLLPSPAPGLRYGYAWHEDAIGLSIGHDITTTVTERADLSYSTQVLVEATLGAVRIQGNGVVRFLINEGN